MLPRIRLFVEGGTAAIAWYAARPSNLRADAFNGADGRGGFTRSLWRSDEAMRDAAYQDGDHPARMEQYRTGLMFDYPSFTRLRALHSHGDWDGDPCADSSACRYRPLRSRAAMPMTNSGRCSAVNRQLPS